MKTVKIIDSIINFIFGGALFAFAVMFFTIGGVRPRYRRWWR